MAAIVQGPSTPVSSPSDPAELVQRTAQYWGFPTLTPETETLVVAFAKAQLGRSNAAPLVETAMRRLVATAPELQSA